MLELSTPPLAVGDVPVWSLLVVAAIGVAGSALAGWLPLWGERLKRKDGMRTYKRETYRNLLDHAYWLERGEKHDAKPRQEREELYVADWHRVRLLGGDDVTKELQGLKTPGSLTDEIAQRLIPILERDLGGKGFTEPS
jgi:hypothetical protein